MRLTNALFIGSAAAGHLHHGHLEEVQQPPVKSRVVIQGGPIAHSHHLEHRHHHHLHHGHGPHVRHFQAAENFDAKVVPDAKEDKTIIIDDGISTESESYEPTGASEIMLTDLITIPEELNSLMEEDDRTLAIELDATEDVDELPAKIAAALHAKAGDLINEKEVRDAIEKVQSQLIEITEMLKGRAAEAAAQAQEINVKAQTAAAKAVERAKRAVGTGAAALKEKAENAQEMAADAANKAQSAAAEAVERAKSATAEEGAAGSTVQTIKDKLAEGAKQSKKAAESVAEDVTNKAKSAAKSAADALNEFAENKSDDSHKRKLLENESAKTTIAVGSVGVGVVAITGLAYAASRNRNVSPPTASSSVEAQQVDTLRDIADGTFDMY